MATRCTCGQGHETFGACIRAKGIRIGYCRSAANLDYTNHLRNTRELDAYKEARSYGVQPAGTQRAQVDYAMEQSARLGRPWQADEVGHADA